MMEFQINKQDLRQTRLVDVKTPPISKGEVLLEIERFGFSANNITYAVTGHSLGYWKFFPPQKTEQAEDWGLLPVWGFAKVVQSECEDLPLGERLFGYWPSASHMKMMPSLVNERRVVDGAAHRVDLPRTYNGYRRSKPLDANIDHPMMLLSPLYITSWCLWDYLVDNNWFEAEQVLIVSASSKTSLGLATALKADSEAKQFLGLTSQSNLNFVQGLGLYDQVLSYDSLSALDPTTPTVIVDMSGSAGVLRAGFELYGEALKYSIHVGLTHWDDPAVGTGIPRDRKEMFFAPGHLQKRIKEWGAAEVDQRSNRFMLEAAAKAQDWIKYELHEGLGGLSAIYGDVAQGKIAPETGLVITL